MERLRRIPRPEQLPELDADPPGPGAPNPPAPANVQVIWGLADERIDIQDLTVGEAYELLRGPLNIAPDIMAAVNGVEAGPGRRLVAGDVLEFIRAAGEKGAAR